MLRLGDGQGSQGEMGGELAMNMRYGDYIICINLFLNACAFIAYAYQGHTKQAIYWVGVGIINGSLLTWR